MIPFVSVCRVILREIEGKTRLETAATAAGGRLVMGVRSVPSSPSFGIVRVSIPEHAATMPKGLQPVVGVVFSRKPVSRDLELYLAA